MVHASEVADLLGVSPARVAQLTSEATFPKGHREGFYVLYDREKVVRWAIENGRIHATGDNYKDPWWGQGHDLQVTGILRNRKGELVHVYADDEDHVPLVTVIRDRFGTYAESIRTEAVDYAQRIGLNVNDVDYVACVGDAGDHARITVARTSDGLVFPVSPKEFRQATGQPVVVEDAGLDEDLVKVSHLNGKGWSLRPGWDGNIDILMDAVGLTEDERGVVLIRGPRRKANEYHDPQAGEGLMGDPDVKVVSTFHPHTHGEYGRPSPSSTRKGISRIASRELSPQTLEIAKIMVSNFTDEDRLSPGRNVNLSAYLAYKSEEIANHIRWTWEPSEPRVGHRLAGADWLVGRDMRHVQGFWVLNGGEGGYAVLYGRKDQAPNISLVLPKDVRADEQFMLVPEPVETSPENVLFLLGQNGTIKALRS